MKFFFFLLVTVLFLTVTACGSEKEEVQLEQPFAKTASYESEKDDLSTVKKFSLVSRTPEGEKEWEVGGSKAKFMPDSKIKLDNATTKVLQKGNSLVMTSKQGFFDRKTKNMRLEGDVKGVFTQISIQNSGKKTVTTVTCDGPLEIDNAEEKATFKKNVVVCNEEGKIFADKIEIFFDDKNKEVTKIIAIGNVRIEKNFVAKKTLDK